MIPIIEKLLKKTKEHYFLKLTFYDVNVITLKSNQKKKTGNKINVQYDYHNKYLLSICSS